MREQFPLTLCYAITAHKSQGQTLEEVIIDFSEKNSRINCGSFYTALSRVRNGENVFLKDFKPEYIKANPDVEKKMESMKHSRPYIFKKIFNDVHIFNEPKDELKIGYVNINGLYSSKSMTLLNNDKNLIHLDFLLVADTRLNIQISIGDLESKLSCWKVIERLDSNDGINHMGLLLLQSRTCQKENIVTNASKKVYVKEENGKKVNQIHVMTATFIKFHVTCAFIYIRKTPTEEEIKRLENFIEHFDLVMGDLNLDTYRAADAKILKFLCAKRRQVLNEITTVRFNQLDHILLDCDLFPEYYATCFRNHTTDHYVIVVRIPKVGNKKTEFFKQQINFNQEQWTRLPTRKRSLVETNKNRDHNNIKKQKESIFMRKRVSTEKVPTTAKSPRTLSPIQGVHRTFRNQDAESCWMNSCLQLVLTALDHQNINEESGSQLWEHLICLIRRGNSSSLDPLPVRDTMINIEKQRILEENIPPAKRLFGLDNAEIFQGRNLLLDSVGLNRLGQQDCKDFFICLSQNKHHWFDVYSLFMVQLVYFTSCTACKYVSRYEGSTSTSAFILLDCPNENISMATLLDNEFNKSETVYDWKDEDGCKKKGVGEKCIRIKDLEETHFLVVILKRLTKIDGKLKILKQKTPMGADVVLQDMKEKSSVFKPIAVIHHRGEVTGNTTRGHYMADVLNMSTNTWFRTSDDEAPKKIPQCHVTNQGYIFLYKKC